MKKLGYECEVFDAIPLRRKEKRGLLSILVACLIKGYVLGSCVFTAFALFSPSSVELSSKTGTLISQYEECRDIMNQVSNFYAENME